MTAAQYRRRRSGVHPMMIVGLVLVVVVGTVGTLFMMGELELSFLSAKPLDDDTGSELSTEGMIPVPVSATTIRALTRVDVAHLFDYQAGGIKTMYLPQSSFNQNIIQDVKEITGRVLRVDLPPNRPFTEGMFYPRGTRPGITGGIPPGKRGIPIQAAGILGFHSLNIGDRFDLCAAAPLESSAGALTEGLEVSGPLRSRIELEAKMKGKQASVRFLVQNGIVVRSVEARKEQYQDSSLIGGSRLKNKEIEEVYIAVDPEEVAPLMEAMALGLQITCIPRSGHPDDPADSMTPGLEPKLPFVLDGDPAADSDDPTNPQLERGDGRSGGVVDTLKQIEVIEGNRGRQDRSTKVVPKKN